MTSRSSLRRLRNAHRHDGVARLRRRQLMADGADAADARGDSRHLVKRAAFGELLKAADLRHLEPRVGDIAGVVQLNGDLGVAFDAAHRLNRDALHRRSYPNLILLVVSVLRPSTSVVSSAAITLRLRRTAGNADSRPSRSPVPDAPASAAAAGRRRGCTCCRPTPST